MAYQGSSTSSSSSEDEMVYGHIEDMCDEVEKLYANVAEESQRIHGGTSGRRSVKNRDRVGTHNRLMNDYFVDRPLYSDDDFSRRYRMRRPLFLRIQGDIMRFSKYFRQTPDAVGKLGLSPEIKMTAALCMLAYRRPADLNDECLKISSTTSLEALAKFCRAVNAIYSSEYLRRPNNADIVRLLRKAEERGLPGMLGSVDCMHWEWKNCPPAWAGHYKGHHGKPTIILEAVASYDTWIWHSYFGPPGASNDLNVLYTSPIFNDVLEGLNTPVQYTVNGREYTQGYYLADGIYPRWSTLVQAIPNATERDKKEFNKKQMAFRKDVERAFGILQIKWEILKGPSRFWKQSDLSNIMQTCIILHNMIVEDNRLVNVDDYVDDPSRYHSTSPPAVLTRDAITITQFLSNRTHIRDSAAYFQLRNDLIAHVWNESRYEN